MHEFKPPVTQSVCEDLEQVLHSQLLIIIIDALEGGIKSDKAALYIISRNGLKCSRCKEQERSHE